MTRNKNGGIKAMLAVFIAMFVLLAVYLVYIIDVYGAYWFASPYNTRVTKQKNAVIAGSISDRRGVTLAESDSDGARHYSMNDEIRLSCAHAVGDSSNQTLGAQALLSKYLLGFEQKAGDRLSYLFSNEKRHGDNVSLTIDAKLNRYAYSLLEPNAGAVIVMNYKTGEVLCMTGAPAFDPEKMDAYLSGDEPLEDGAMVNRATMGRYTPGSTFKLITAVAALRYLPDAENRVFVCDGPLAFDAASGKQVSLAEAVDSDGNVKEGYALLKDFEDEVHGEITLSEAMKHSCNHTFACIALEIGADRLTKTAESLGIGGEYAFSELVAYCGSMEKPTTDFELAWSGVGQHKDIITPVQLCMLTAGIANGGVAMEPKICLSVSDKSGNIQKRLTSKEYKELFRGNEAEFLAEAMRGVVTGGTGKNAAVDGLSVCGKTGTAEVSSSGKFKPHAWFTGFVAGAAHPYAITVIMENGGGGGKIAAPMAATVLEKMMELGY